MAARKKITPYSFVSGVVQDRNTFRGIAQIDELNEAEEPNTTLLTWVRSEAQWYTYDLDWYANQICAIQEPERLVLIIGPDGRVFCSSGDGQYEEQVHASKGGPQLHGDLRGLRFIGGRFYATGMGRQVYRRERKGQWVHRDAGALTEPSTEDVRGFNAIDGLSDNDVYAVGFGGEIWHSDGKTWSQVESPTNVALNKVRVVRRDLVFVCGPMGTLLCGHGKKWEVIAQDATEVELWDMEWFNDALYIATDDALLRLTPDGSLEPVDFKTGHQVTCGSLHAHEGVLLSVGRKHVLWTENGKKWNDITL